MGMENPGTTSRKSFTLTTYNTDGEIYKIDEASEIFYLEFTVGAIKCLEIVPTLNEIMLADVAYTFSI